MLSSGQPGWTSTVPSLDAHIPAAPSAKPVTRNAVAVKPSRSRTGSAPSRKFPMPLSAVIRTGLDGSLVFALPSQAVYWASVTEW